MKTVTLFKTVVVFVSVSSFTAAITFGNAKEAEIGKDPAAQESREVPAQEEQKPEMKMEMKKMKMYKAAEVDGCSDFHCLKCSNRDACSEDYCDIKDCGHKHGAVLCHSGILFYIREAAGIRDEQGILSCTTRAKLIAERINKYLGMSMEHKACYFTVLDEVQGEVISDKQIPTIWFKMAAGAHAHKVLSVTGSDLSGYKYRSQLPVHKDKSKPANKITKKLVAQWWAYLLKDHFKMMVLGEAPYLTVYTHCGMVLKKMWTIAKKKVPEGKIPMMVWKDIVKNELSEEEQDHLYLAAQIIPKNFDPNIR